MKKWIKIFIEAIAMIVLLGITLLLTASIILQIPLIQNIIAKKLSDIATKQVETTVTIGKLSLGIFNKVTIEDLYVESPISKGDTLLFINKASTKLIGIDLAKKELLLEYAKVKGGSMLLKTDSANVVNLKYVTDHLKPKVKDPNRKLFSMKIDEISIDSVTFGFAKHTPREIESGVNYEDMSYRNISIAANGFDLLGNNIKLSIDSLSFRERSGINLSKITADSISISPENISIKSSAITVDESTIDIRLLSLDYQDWDMSDFINKVKIKTSISDSHIELSNLERFTGKKRNWHGQIRVIGSAEGYISDLTTNILLAECYDAKVTNSTLTLIGLPKIENTTFDLHLNSLSTKATDISHIINGFTSKMVAMPKAAINLGLSTISGSFNGDINRFNATGKLSSYAGDVEFEFLNIKNPNSMGINGSINTSNFHIGALLESKELGNITVSSKVNGYLAKQSSNIAVSAIVKSLMFKSYNYQDIFIDGSIDSNEFLGYVSCNDKNIDFNFNGSINLDSDTPVYNFDLLIDNVDLAKLNINTRDSISQFSGEIVANGSGINIDKLDGLIMIDRLVYVNHTDSIRSDKITITTQNTENNRFIKINSKFADIELAAKQSFSSIIPFFKKTIGNYLPALQNKSLDLSQFRLSNPTNIKITDSDSNTDTKIEDAKNNYYILKASVKEANNVAGIFVPGLEIAKGSGLSFMFNPLLNQFAINLNSEEIKVGDKWATGVELSSRNVVDSIALYLRADQLNIESIYMPNISIVSSVKENNILSSIRFSNDNDGSNALLSAKMEFKQDTQNNTTMRFGLNRSYITIDNNRWDISESKTEVSKNGIDIKNFIIRNNDQSLNINGIYSRNEGDTLSLTFNDFKLDGFSTFISTLGYNIKGNLNGELGISRNGLGNLFLANINIDSLMLNEYKIPTISINTIPQQNPDSMGYSIMLGNKRVSTAFVDFNKRNYHAAVKIDSIYLKAISPLLKGIGHNCNGVAGIDVIIDNDNRPINVNGEVNVYNFTTKIDFTNVEYSVKSKVNIKDNLFTMVEGQLSDTLGTTSLLTGMLNGGDRYAKVKYNIGAEPKGLLCLDTKESDNPLFYGNIFADGKFNIDGHGTNVLMSISAKGVNNSKFYMPISDKSTINEADFITFAKNDSAETEIKRDFINIKRKKRNASEANFELDINVSVDNDTEVQLVIDPTLGDILKAKGKGELDMHIVPAESKITMNGEYEITNGSYLFTLPNFSLLNKYFVIKEGSSIMWSGDPLAANLAITATYQTKTSLTPLLGSLYNSRVNVDCDLSLSGKLLKPDITLGISVPEADPETQSLISSALNTEEAISKQIFWLLFSNSFYADATQSGTSVTVGMMGTAGAVTGIEFLSNQISNWISSDKFNLGINYMPKSDLASDELELNISAPLLDNRLILEAEGNYDFKNNTAYTSSNVKSLSGNFYVTYIIDDKGNLRLKAFTRQINTFDENQGLQESGLGIYFKDEFNKISDLVERFNENRAKRKFKKETKRSQKEQME